MGNKNRTRTPPSPGVQTTFQNVQPRRTQPQWAEPYKAIPRSPRVSPVQQAKAPQPAPPSPNTRIISGLMGGGFIPQRVAASPAPSARAVTGTSSMDRGRSPRPMMDKVAMPMPPQARTPMPAQALQQRAPQWARPYQHIDR